MSGVTGASRVKSIEDYWKFYNDYTDLISEFPGYSGINISGSIHDDTKTTFGDIDIIVTVDSPLCKCEIKKLLVLFLEESPEDIIVPFTSEKYKGRRTYNSGEIVTVNFFSKRLGYSVQIDNIIAMDEVEAMFKINFLNWSAPKQGLILGLVKVATVEHDIEELFERLNINNSDILDDNQEWEFSLSSKELQLRLVTYEDLINYKEINRKIVWKSSCIGDVLDLLNEYDLDTDFYSILKEVDKTLKYRRSIRRLKGVFRSMVSVKSGEVGTQKARDKNNALYWVENLK